MNTFNNLWRKFLTCFLSFMLFSLNLTIDFQTKQLNISSSNAYAQTTQTTTSSGNAKGKSGTIEIKGAEGNFLTGGLVSTVVLLAAAFFISKLYISFNPSKPWDVTGAAIAAGIYVMAEVMEMMSAKATIESKTLEYTTRGEDGKIDDEQYQALVKEKEILEQVKSSAEKKSKFQLGASAAFGVSAALAFTSDSLIKVDATACATASKAALAAGELAFKSMVTSSASVLAPTLAPVAGLAQCGLVGESVTALEALRLEQSMKPSILKGTTVQTNLKAISGQLTTCEGVSASTLAEYSPKWGLSEALKYDACYEATLTKQAMCISSCGVPLAAACLAPCNGAQKVEAGICTATRVSDHTLDKTALANNALFVSAQKSQTASCLKYVADTTLAVGGSVVGSAASIELEKNNETLISGLINILIPKAQAASGSLIGMLLGVIGGLYVPVSTYLDRFIAEPFWRAWVWTALSAYTLLVKAQTDDAAKKAQEGIDAINKILKMMDRSRTATSVISNVASSGAINKGRVLAFPSLDLPEGETLPCISSPGANCPVNSFSTNSRLTNSGSIPSGLAPAVSSLLAVGDGISGKASVSGDTQSAIDQLGAYANAVEKMNEKLQRKSLGNFKNNKKSPKELSDQLISSLNKAASSGKAGNVNLGFRGNSLGNSAPNLGNGNSSIEKDADVSTGMVDVTGGTGKGSGNKDSGFEFGLSPEETLAAHNAELSANAEAAAETGVITDDIIKDKSEDLFKVISIRYKKAYDRLLDEL